MVYVNIVLSSILFLEYNRSNKKWSVAIVSSKQYQVMIEKEHKAKELNGKWQDAIIIILLFKWQKLFLAMLLFCSKTNKMW